MGILMSNSTKRQSTTKPRSQNVINPNAVHPNATCPNHCVHLCQWSIDLCQRQQPQTLLHFGELSLHNPLACHSLHFFKQTPSSVQSFNIITATNTPATDKHVWYRPPSRAFCKCSLEARAQRMGVKLDDIRSRDDGILFQQYPFGFGGEGTVGLAEDNYYVSQVNKYDLVLFGA